MLWISVVSISYGLLMLLDPLMYTFISYKLGVSSIYLGICSALWSILYIFTSMFLSFLADEGRSRLLMVIALTSITFSWLTLSSLNMFTAFVSYMLHAISMASANLALNTVIFENIDSYYWSRALIFTRFVGNTVRGVLFIALAMINVIEVSIVLQISIVTLLISTLLIPSYTLVSERSIYRLYKLTREIGSYIKASTSLLLIDNPSIARDVFQGIWSRGGTGLSAKKVSTLVMMVTCVGDYVTSLLPILIRDRVNIQILWIAYGITSLFSIASLYMLREAEGGSRGQALLLILIRSAILILGINVVHDIATLTAYLIVNSLLFSIIDLTLYNIYISSTAGYGSSLYYTLRELGSVIGSVLGGFLLTMGMNIYIGTAITLSIITALLTL